MKFTNEQAREKIVAQLTNNGKTDLQMSERSVKEAVDTLLPLVAGDDDELDAVVGKISPLLQTMNNNHKKDVSDFVTKWKKEHPEEKPKPTEGSTKPSTEQDPMETRLAELERKLAERDRLDAAKTKRKEVADKLAEKGVKDQEWVDAMLDEVTLGADSDAEALAERYVKLYNKGKAQPGKGATPRVAGGGEPTSPLADVSAYMKQQREENKL